MKRLVCVFALCMAAGAACTEDDGPLLPTEEQLDCSVPRPGLAPLRRLSKAEYGFTVADLFGHPASIAEELPDENYGLDGYDNYADSSNINQLRAERLFAAAETVSNAAVDDLTSLLPCPVAQIDDACIDQFVRVVGRRSYRRDLAAEELAILRTLYDAASQADTPERVAHVLQGLLMAPQFVFRPERGTSVEAAPGVVLLDGYEIATRLSYLVWASTPDDALLDAAASGQLDTAEGIRQEVERMLGEPQARRGVVHFLTQWLQIAEFDNIIRDPELFEYDDQLGRDIKEQTERFLARVVIDEGGSLADLLTSRDVEVNADLASIYGVSHSGGAGWEPATLPEAERKGVLTLSAWLTKYGFSRLPATFRRGVYVKTRLLCDPLGDPDPDADLSPVVLQPGTSNREALEARLEQSASCQKCHLSFKDFGYAFENFDALGRFQTEEFNGAPIDVSGEVWLSEDLDGAFDSWSDLIDRLAESKDVSDCMGRQVFRYANARRAEDADACALEQLNAEPFRSVGDMLAEIALSDGFRYRNVEGE